MNCLPVDDVKAKSSSLLHHISEMLIQFRGSSRYVQGMDGWAVLVPAHVFFHVHGASILVICGVLRCMEAYDDPVLYWCTSVMLCR